ncbi:uncharacterized protein LOC125651450 [Ostrea edulis]|uniref:uncharacterized protein LOC125651450 n=1 Tax=Ostrea edulis TaxID=37623 RepID=UPI0024AF8C60|nr:uncharacterized protein LOC125651450 [Ostrea edulis]
MYACTLFPIICLFLTVADGIPVNNGIGMPLPFKEEVLLDYNGDVSYMPNGYHNFIPQYGNSYPTNNNHGNQNYMYQQASRDFITSHYQSQQYGHKAHRPTDDYLYQDYLNKPYGEPNRIVPRDTTYKQTGGQKVKNGMEYNKHSSYANYASHGLNAKSVTRFGTPQKKKFYWPYYPYSASDYGNPLYVPGNEYKQDTHKTYHERTEYRGTGKSNGIMNSGKLQDGYGARMIREKI